MGEGATGAMKVGGATEDGGDEEETLRGREEGGEEVDRWGLAPWAAAAAGGRQGGVLALEDGFALAAAEAEASGFSAAAFAAGSGGAGDRGAGAGGLLGAARASTAAVAVAASASGGVEELGVLPSEGGGILSSTGLLQRNDRRIIL